MDYPKNKIISNFKSRLKTQDRGSRLPMKVITKFYPSKSPEGKLFNNLLNDAINRIILLVDKEGQHIAFQDVNFIKIDEKTKLVDIVLKDKTIKPLFTEVYSRKIRGHKYEPLISNSLDIRDLSLDHNIPISCLLDSQSLRFDCINSLNNRYSDFIDENPKCDSQSERAKLFFENIQNDCDFGSLFRQRLLDELSIIFKTGELTIMEKKYNTSKNNSFEYCDQANTCPYSEIRKILDKYNI